MFLRWPKNTPFFTVERLLNCEVPLRAQYIRVLFCEITQFQIIHLLQLLMLWIPGAVMHAASYDRGVAQDLPLGLCRDIDSSTQQFRCQPQPYLKQRLVDIGTAIAQAKDWGFSGVMLRGRMT
ncbi:hypothetical protein ZWY2020_060059 [Hordeum vulgare]|nr:hypothetical protein ZWY2020_060059 [Hordeum vulgare]